MDKEVFIKDIAAEHRRSQGFDRILWPRHAVTKLDQERLGRTEVESALLECWRVEDYPTVGRPLPDCLVLCFVAGAPVHATIAIDEEMGRVDDALLPR